METIDKDRHHRVIALKSALREVNNQISLLSHRVSIRAALNNIDLNTLDFLSQHGGMSATALAKGIGLHPATMTGVLDRLEKGGWIVRERTAEDRRAIVVRAAKDRGAEIYQLYSGMNASMEGLLDGYSERDLTVIADFLTR